MVTVYVDMNPVVNRLTVGATDGVVVNNGQQFSLGGTSPSLDVVGMFFLNSTGNATALYAVNPATIQGGGTVFLGGTSSQNYILGNNITLASGTNIQGQGDIQAPLVNNGTVTATGLGLTLSGSTIDNEGTMTANGGLLTFKNTSITNNGTIKNNDFSDSGPNTLVFNSATIYGNGTSSLINPNGGQVQLNSSSLYDHNLGAGAVQIGGATSFYGKNTLNAGTSINVPDGQGLSFYDHGGSDPATLIGGNVTLASSGKNTYFSASNALSLQSNLVLGGTSSQNYVTGNTITLAGGYTIQGQGYIQAPLVNNGAVTATGLGLTLSGSTIDNEGTMTSGGPLTFNSTTITNNGTIQNNAATDTLAFNGATIYGNGTSSLIDPKGGSLQLNSSSLYDHQLGAGAVQIGGATYFYGKNTLNAGTSINVPDGQGLYFHDHGGSDPATLIGGDVTLASAGNATYFSASNALSLQSNLVLGGTSSQNYVTGSTIILAGGYTIQGQGYIQAPLVNNGAVTATGLGLTLSGSTIDNEGTMTSGGPLTFNSTTITNNGTIQNNAATDTLAFNSATISGTGLIDPKGGSLQLNSSSLYDHQLGAGTVQIGGTTYFYGKNTLNAGTSINVPDGQGLYFHDHGGSDPATLIGGDVTLASAGNATYFSASNALSLQSNLVLGGTSSQNYVTGSTITLAGGYTIQGQGYIQAPLVNNGAVTATGLGLTLSSSAIDNEGTMTSGGPLTFNSTTISNNGTIQNNAATDTLAFNGATIYGNGTSSLIDPKGGSLQLNSSSLYDHQLGAGAVQIGGATYFYGKNTLNAGTSINVPDGQGLYFYDSLSNHATLIGGDVTLASAGNATYFSASNALSLQSNLVLGGTSSQNYVTGSTITLAAGYTIQGQGYIQAPLVNNGAVTAQGGNLTISGGITGNGAVSVLGNATLNILSNLQVGNLNMTQFTNLAVQNGQTVRISQDFTFAQQTPSSWNWGAGTTLLMDGSGTPQRLEVGGKDYGYVPAGFSNNFNLQNLDINGDGTDVYLTDWINNGQRGGRGGSAEALYVDSLYIALGDTLNLNGLHLYVEGFGLVRIGTWRNGGGMITNPSVPIPGTLLLVGSGLLGLAGFKRIRRS
jgi:filamentous hemagglutinin